MSQSRQEIFEEVKAIVVEKLKVEAGNVTEDKHFIRDLGADSLDVVEFTMELESRFKLDEIPEEAGEKLQTVGAVVDYILENAKE